jgi:hypothetical protein
MMVSMG